MATFNFNVDTDPMAERVDSASRRLNGITGAVTAMQAAVIAAEVKASKTICTEVEKGFYGLIESQISRKAIAAKNEMDSKLNVLVQLAKALDRIEQQMEKDFHMISRRYAKLFGSLNKALETRVKELDRPAMQLGDIKKKMIFGKLKDDSSLLLNTSGEALPIAQMALSGKLKQKTREAMRTLSGSVTENLSYTDKVESILVKNENDFSGGSGQRFIPAIFSVTDSILNPNDHIENIYIAAQAGAWQNTAPIVSEVSRIQNDFSWVPLSTEGKERIRREFVTFCEREQCEERLSKEIIRLFEESTWEDCKNELL